MSARDDICRNIAAATARAPVGVPAAACSAEKFLRQPAKNGVKLLDKIPAVYCSYRPLPPPLHGDLWSGNVGFDEAGKPVIFDPAVYYGDRGLASQ